MVEHHPPLLFNGEPSTLMLSGYAGITHTVCTCYTASSLYSLNNLVTQIYVLCDTGIELAYVLSVLTIPVLYILKHNMKIARSVDVTMGQNVCIVPHYTSSKK